MDAANEIDFLTGSGSANFSRNLRTSSLERRRRAGSGPSPRHESGSVLGSGPAPLIQSCSGELQNTDRCSSLNSGSACSRIRPPGRDPDRRRLRVFWVQPCSGPDGERTQQLLRAFSHVLDRLSHKVKLYPHGVPCSGRRASECCSGSVLGSEGGKLKELGPQVEPVPPRTPDISS